MEVNRSEGECMGGGAQFSITHFITVRFYHITYTFRANLHSVIV